MIQHQHWARMLRSDGQRVRRSWPRSEEHLLLEVIDRSGRATAGQWFAESDRAARVAERTPGSDRIGTVVLQPGGGDRRLPALAPLLALPGHRLVSHRPERRAVVAAPGVFVKVVRPERQREVARRARLAQRCGLTAPRVIADDAGAGTLSMDVLPGFSLTDLLRGAGAEDACRAAGQAVARLHDLRPESVDSHLDEHGPEQERAVLSRWVELAGAYGLLDEDELRAAGESVELRSSGRRTVIHRDLHDGQLMIDGDQVGILDFDLLAVGDPALDLANLMAHLELRAQQGLLDDADAAVAATVEGYRPDADVRAALPGYLAASRERLRAVYAFRDPELVS